MRVGEADAFRAQYHSRRVGGVKRGGGSEGLSGTEEKEERKGSLRAGAEMTGRIAVIFPRR